MITVLTTGCTEDEVVFVMSDYEDIFYNSAIFQVDYFASNLAVTNEDGTEIGLTSSTDIYGSGLFGVDDGIVYHGYNLFETFYPASTTKIITAYVALKYGNLTDEIVITEEDIDLPSDSSICDLEVGDTVTLYDLLSGLLLQSGNDCALAIARYISGDIDTFAVLMTEEAAALGATNSNFVNPHGLHDENHYTTVYDLYLMFNECIKNETFLEIISKSTYDTIIVESDGTERSVTWNATNYYALGYVASPSNVTVIGGKTGYTDSARNCLIILVEAEDGSQYISAIMGAVYKDVLYSEMTTMIELLY